MIEHYRGPGGSSPGILGDLSRGIFDGADLLRVVFEILGVFFEGLGSL